MTRNVGGIDRVLRIIIGLAVLSLTLLLEGDMRWAGLLGLLPLITGIVGNCPLYTVIGVSTCPLKPSRR